MKKEGRERGAPAQETPDVTLRHDPADVRLQLRNFLDMSDQSDFNRLDVEFEPYQLVDLHRALDYAFTAAEGYAVTMRGLGGLLVMGSHGQLVPLTSPHLDVLLTQTTTGGPGWTGKQRLDVGPERTQDFPRHALYLVSQGRHRIILQLFRGALGPPTLLAVTRNSQEEDAWAAEVVCRLRHWMRLHSCLRTRMLRPINGGDGVTYRFLSVPDASEIELPEGLADQLQRSFLDFQIHRTVLGEVGLEARRGILLHGEPGTGKTVSCRWLKSRLPEHTFFVVDSQSFSVLGAVFAAARQLAPAVVVIEDVDMIAQERSVGSQNWILGDLLNLLDGMQDRDDVGIILTSNSGAFLERALVDRPGRIDHVVTYEPPADAQRAHLLRSFTQDLKVDVPDEQLVSLTAGLTPAQIREVVKRAVILSLKRNGEGEWPRALSATDFALGLESLRASQACRKDRRIGLRLTSSA